MFAANILSLFFWASALRLASISILLKTVKTNPCSSYPLFLDVKAFKDNTGAERYLVILKDIKNCINEKISSKTFNGYGY